MRTWHLRSGTILVGVAAAIALQASPAMAYGVAYENRGCGTNKYESTTRLENTFPYPGAYSQRVSGTCAGRLAVEGTYRDGGWGRIPGTSNYASYGRSDGKVTGGRHWGCDACGGYYT